MAASLLVAIAGTLGILYVGVRAAGATMGDDVPGILQSYPLEVTTALSAAAVALGIGAYRYQSALLVGLGIAAAVFSVGMLGVSSIIALTATWPLARSFFEGEETRLDHRIVSSRRWPDKAVMASVMLAAGGSVSLVQAALLLVDGMDPIAFAQRPWLWGAFSLVCAGVAWVAARQAFYVSNPRWAAVGAWLTIAAAGFYIVGPLLGVGALVYLSLAHREEEFTVHGRAA